MHPWLSKLRHDLVKRALWTARDLRDTGQEARASDLRALRAGFRELPDAEGHPVTALALWAQLLEEAPAGALARPAVAGAADAFGAALAAADAAVARLAAPAQGLPEALRELPAALEAALAVDGAFEALARAMKDFP